MQQFSFLRDGWGGAGEGHNIPRLCVWLIRNRE